jgi:hypothetical protein
MAELVTHYKQKEMSEDGAKSFAKRTAYEFSFKFKRLDCAEVGRLFPFRYTHGCG